MKRKILALGVFSLCCLGLFVAPTQAFFGLFSPWNCHNRYTTHITCRPYNAFTPICWGNLVCDGCCPSPCAVAGGCMPMCLPPQTYGPGPGPLPGPGMGIPYMGAPCAGGSCGPDGCCASDMPMQHMPMQMPMQAMPMQMPMQMPMHAMPMQMQPQMPMQMQPQMPMPDIRTQPYAPSMPMLPNHTMVYPPMQNGITQANYYPSYYPGYYPGYTTPMNYNPYLAYPSAAMPYYWYGSGR